MFAGTWSDDDDVAMPHTHVATTGPTPKTAKHTKNDKTTKKTKNTKKTQTALTPSNVAKVAKKPAAATKSKKGKLAQIKSALTKHYNQHGSVYKLKPFHYMVDKHTARPLLETTLGRPLALATDFGGIETPSQALENLGIKHDLKFYTECQGHLREFVGSAFRPDLIYCDVLDRLTETMPSCDLFVLGPPCQPWSKAGQRMGIQDLKKRGVLLFGSMEYVKSKTPKVFVLENVLNLVHAFRSEFDQLVSMLEDIGYETTWDVINSYDCNLPQSRARVYLVGIFGGCAPGRNFRFPVKLQHRVDLEACLDSRTQKTCDDDGPALPARCLRKVARAMHEAKTDPLNSHSIP
jgi:hypothetical protein